MSKGEHEDQEANKEDAEQLRLRRLDRWAIVFFTVPALLAVLLVLSRSCARAAA